MRFSHVAVSYLLIGAIVIGSGVVPPSEAGLLDEFVEIETNGDGGLADVESDTDEEELTGAVGPVRNALDTIAGGAILAVWSFVSSLIGYVAWPITITRAIDAPQTVVLLSSVMVASFVFGTLRIIRASL
jgi:hypothetical protein